MLKFLWFKITSLTEWKPRMHGSELFNFVQDNEPGPYFVRMTYLGQNCIVQLTYSVQNNQSILYKIKRPGVLFYEVGLFCTQRSFNMQLLLIFCDLYFKRFLIFFLPIIDEFSPIETDPVLHSIEKLSIYIDFNNDVVAWAFVELDFHFQNFRRLTRNLNINI